MKWLGLCLLVVSAVLAYGQAGDQSQKADKTQAWKLVNLSSAYKSYVHPPCSVSVHEDQKGVTLQAFDDKHPSRFGPLQQTVYIRKEQEKVKIDEFRTQGSLILFPPGGYNIFVVKCGEAARKLPAEVQRLFYGYSGVGKADP